MIIYSVLYYMGLLCLKRVDIQVTCQKLNWPNSTNFSLGKLICHLTKNVFLCSKERVYSFRNTSVLRKTQGVCFQHRLGTVVSLLV